MSKKNKNIFKDTYRSLFGNKEDNSNDLSIDTNLNSTTASSSTIATNGTGHVTINGTGSWTSSYPSSKAPWSSVSTSTHTIQGAFLIPKSKEQAVKDILTQLELGHITREDLLMTIEYEKMNVSRYKIGNIVDQFFPPMSEKSHTLECAEAALMEHDIKLLLKG